MYAEADWQTVSVKVYCPIIIKNGPHLNKRCKESLVTLLLHLVPDLDSWGPRANHI